MTRAQRLKAARREWHIEGAMKRLGCTRAEAITKLDNQASAFGRKFGHAGGARNRRKALGQIGD